jgi:hypothetical protein
MLLEYILFCIFCYVISSVIVQQKIFEEPRAWLKQCSADNPNWFRRKLCQFVSCMFCTGFWAGVFISLFLGFSPVNIELYGLLNDMFSSYVLDGLLGAFGSYTLHLLMGLLIKHAESLKIDT